LKVVTLLQFPKYNIGSCSWGNQSFLALYYRATFADPRSASITPPVETVDPLPTPEPEKSIKDEVGRYPVMEYSPNSAG